MFPTGVHVLLVDDDADTRFLMCAMLRKRGFTVEAVESAEACLEFLAAHPDTIVVTDVEMPGMSGIELCRIIAERYPNVVAIIVSGMAVPPTIEQARQTGAFTFLPKPVSMQTLESILHQASESLAT